MKKCIIFILKIPFLLIKYILCFIKWILKMLFGWIFGWIPDFDERMSGEEFEEYVKEILKRNGFKSLELTKRSGDYGVDILGKYQGEVMLFNVKNMQSLLVLQLFNKLIQDVNIMNVIVLLL